MKDLNTSVSIYKKQLAKGHIQKAYTALVKHMMKLRTVFKKKHSDKFSVGSVLQGYMDFTYFYYSNAYLEKQKLKFGLVLNHKEMRFELWLLGKTIDIQKKYWDVLKTTKWNNNKTEMPKYSVLEIILVDKPDFNNLENLTKQIENKTIKIHLEIIKHLKTTH